jgi:HK97 family phage major capsid protein
LLTGLTGGVSIPRETGVQTISFLHETDSITPTDSTFGALNLTPHRLGGAGYVTQQLDVQTGGIASQFVMESLAIGVARAVDRAASKGRG